MPLRDLLDKSGVAVALDILLPLLLLLVLPLVSFHVVLSVLLPLLGLVHHVQPFSLQLLCRELPTEKKKHGKMSGIDCVVVKTIL